MGRLEGKMEPSGFFPSGLLPNQAASVTRVLDPERWARAEERTAELISCIQPNQQSEDCRNAVASYVQQLIMKCFACQVFTFGSVPLKTYLPDGDIDLTAFSKNQNLKDNWADEVLEILEREKKSENAEFHVKEVQYIQAEVKLIKCLVENIVVDISFNQLGGLSTLLFLQEVDGLIDQNHLLKRSIILIKAWCYYESRILGAHHGLISTYALETLVLYIFHVFNNQLAGPLEVLYRFLEFFSKFDWENFCISLWGPVPIGSLPNITGTYESLQVNPPREDGRESILGKSFLAVCRVVHSAFPGQQENLEQLFVPKYFNVIDPLRANNNLGRSVSKGNFFRIRSAFAFGAQQLARILNCPKESLLVEIDQFFSNTWSRHGKGHCLDVPSPCHLGMQSINSNKVDGSKATQNFSRDKRAKENLTVHVSEVEGTSATCESYGVSSQHHGHGLQRTSRTGNRSSFYVSSSREDHDNSMKAVPSDQNHQTLKNNNVKKENGRSLRTDNLENGGHARCHFARTYSSPKLIHTSNGKPSKGQQKRVSETRKNRISSGSSDNRSRISGCEAFENLSQSSDGAVYSESVSNGYCGDSGTSNQQEDHLACAETMQMQKGEQDLLNMTSFLRGHRFNSQGHMPVNWTSVHPPFLVPPPIISASEYAQMKPTGMLAQGVPSFESSWASNQHYSEAATLPRLHCFPSPRRTLNEEGPRDLGDGDLASVALSQEDSDHDSWSEKHPDFVRPYNDNTRSSQTQPWRDRKRQASIGSNYVQSSQVGRSGGVSARDHGLIVEERGGIRENHGNDAKFRRTTEVHAHSSASSSFLHASNATTSRSKLHSEDYWGESHSKTSGSRRNRWENKSVGFEDPSAVHEVGENGWQHKGQSIDCISSNSDDDHSEQILLSTVGAASSHIWPHQALNTGPASVSGTPSMLPVTSVLLGSQSQQRVDDGGLPFAFYPAGPAIPFLTMLPVYNLPSERETTNNFVQDEESNDCQNSQSDQSFDSIDNVNQLEILSACKSEKDAYSHNPSKQGRSDILNGDFASHWQNLQYGRFSQNSEDTGSMHYPSPIILPPMYFQGNFKCAGPGRPAANPNLSSQVLNDGPRLSVSSPLPNSTEPVVPRNCSGTGTYLPNPMLSFKKWQSSSTKSHRGNRRYGRRDHNRDREENWNRSPKTQFGRHSQVDSQIERPAVRMDGNGANNYQSSSLWKSKQDSLPPCSLHNNSFSVSNSNSFGSPDVLYGMCPLPVVNPGGVPLPGPAVSSLVMPYLFDKHKNYVSPEHRRYGSSAPVHFSIVDKASHLGEAVNERLSFQEASDLSSPDQPSSPNDERED